MFDLIGVAVLPCVRWIFLFAVFLIASPLLRWDNWYYSGMGDFLQSSVQNIKLQNTLGGGVGRYLKNTNHVVWTATGGLAWQQVNYHENFVPVSSENVASALVSSNLSLFYFDKTALTVKALVLPALSDPGRVHFSLNTSSTSSCGRTSSGT